MKVSCEVKEGISKNEKKYYYLEIFLTPTYTKKVFLDKAELELIKIALSK